MFKIMGVLMLLHLTIFRATCFAILFLHKLLGKFANRWYKWYKYVVAVVVAVTAAAVVARNRTRLHFIRH